MLNVAYNMQELPLTPQGKMTVHDWVETASERAVCKGTLSNGSQENACKAEGKTCESARREIDFDKLHMKDLAADTKPAPAEPMRHDAVVANDLGRGMIFRYLAANVKDIATDCKEIACNSKGITSNSKGIASDSKDIASDSKIIASDSKDIAADGKVIASNSKGIASDSKDIASDSKIIASDSKDIAAHGKVIASNSKGIASDSKDIASDSKDIAADSKVIAADSKVIAADSKDIAADSKVIAADGKVIATNGNVIAASGKVIAASNKDIAANGKVIAADGKVIATNGNVIAASNKDIAANGKVIAASSKDIASDTCDSKDIALDSKDIASDGRAIPASSKDTASNSKDIASDSKDIAFDRKDIVSDSTAISSDSTAIASDTTAIASDSTAIASDSKDSAAGSRDIAAVNDAIAADMTDAVPAVMKDTAAIDMKHPAGDIHVRDQAPDIRHGMAAWKDFIYHMKDITQDTRDPLTDITTVTIGTSVADDPTYMVQAANVTKATSSPSASVIVETDDHCDVLTAGTGIQVAEVSETCDVTKPRAECKPGNMIRNTSGNSAVQKTWPPNTGSVQQRVYPVSDTFSQPRRYAKTLQERNIHTRVDGLSNLGWHHHNHHLLGNVGRVGFWPRPRWPPVKVQLQHQLPGHRLGSNFQAQRVSSSQSCLHPEPRRFHKSASLHQECLLKPLPAVTPLKRPLTSNLQDSLAQLNTNTPLNPRYPSIRPSSLHPKGIAEPLPAVAPLKRPLASNLQDSLAQLNTNTPPTLRCPSSLNGGFSTVHDRTSMSFGTSLQQTRPRLQRNIGHPGFVRPTKPGQFPHNTCNNMQRLLDSFRPLTGNANIPNAYCSQLPASNSLRYPTRWSPGVRQPSVSSGFPNGSPFATSMHKQRFWPVQPNGSGRECLVNRSMSQLFPQR